MSTLRRMTVVALAAFLLPAWTAQAQDMEKKLKLQIAYGAKDRPADAARIVLRPNGDFNQAVYLHLYNPGPAIKKDLKVQLLAVPIDGPPRLMVKGVVKLIGINASSPIVFEKTTPADAKMPLPRVDGPPFLVRVLVDDGKGETALDAEVTLQEPRQYLEVTRIGYNDARRRLSVQVRSKDADLDPPAPVALDLQPAVIPGLVPSKAGTFQAAVDKQQPEVELFADDVRFQDIRPRNGRIYVTADGYERAFLFKGSFAQGIPEPLPVDLPRVRIIMPRYVQPGPELKVPLQIDGSLGANYQVEVAFDAAGNDTFVPIRPMRGLREQSIQYATAETGELLFKAKVQDWVATLKTSGVFGRRKIRVRIKDFEDRYVELANEQDLREETLSLFSTDPSNRFAPLSFNPAQRAVYAEVVLDATPPQIEAVINLPAKGAAPKAVLVPAVKIVRTVDQSPLDRVIFYLGKTVKDDQPEPERFVEARFDPARQVWVPKDPLVVPEDQKDKIVVNVRASTLANLVATRSTEVLLAGPDAAVAIVPAKGTISISGLVVRGGRPQPNVNVYLEDAKKKEVKAMVKTDDLGRYRFKDVPPGQYNVAASRPADNTFGIRPLLIAEGAKDNVEKLDIGLVVK